MCGHDEESYSARRIQGLTRFLQKRQAAKGASFQNNELRDKMAKEKEVVLEEVMAKYEALSTTQTEVGSSLFLITPSSRLRSIAKNEPFFTTVLTLLAAVWFAGSERSFNFYLASITIQKVGLSKLLQWAWKDGLHILITAGQKAVVALTERRR